METSYTVMPRAGILHTSNLAGTSSETQGAACPIAPGQENATLWKQIVMFFFRFGVCPMCMTSSVTYSLYELVRFRRIRVEKSLWSGKP